MLKLDEYEMSSRQRACFHIAAILSAVLVSYLYYRSLLFSVVILPFIPRIKKYIVNSIIDKRKWEYLGQYKDFLFLISTSIGAGRSMKDAIGESIPGLEEIYGKGSLLSSELCKAYDRMSVGRENDVEVMYDMALSSGLEDVIDFVTIYSVCKKTGASLIIAMNKAASAIMDKITIDKEIKELVKRKESEGLIIFAMPTIVIAFMSVFAPDYISPLYTTIEGRLIMTAVIAASIGVYGMIQKIVRVDI